MALKRVILAFCLSALILPALPALADQRKALAEQYFQIFDMKSQVYSMAIQLGFDDSDPEKVKAVMPKLEALAIDAVAKTFTEQELQALVKFYSSELGQSIANKTNGDLWTNLVQAFQAHPEYFK